MPGDRRGLLADPLHQVAVGGDRVDVVVDDSSAGPVVALGQEPLGDRQPDGVGDPLSERAGRRLDAGRQPELLG